MYKVSNPGDGNLRMFCRMDGTTASYKVPAGKSIEIKDEVFRFLNSAAHIIELFKSGELVVEQIKEVAKTAAPKSKKKKLSDKELF